MDNDRNIETTVVLKAMGGNDLAKGMLYKQYSTAMFNICTRMTGDKNQAQDILQDAFILAFKNISQVKNELNFGGWLKRIVINECIKHSKKSVKWFDLEEEHEQLYNSDENSWFHHVDLEKVHEEIKNLPDGCRQIFNLYVLEDFHHKKIAEVLNISESTSKSQYQRARMLLKQRLLKNMVEHGRI